LDELVDPVRRLKPTIGFLTCHPTEGEFPFIDGCARMASRIGLKIAFPAHYGCFVKRTFDPNEWAARVHQEGVDARVIGYNHGVMVP
jgi:L-ascorbate metabolism protein UlaG (beta-lactamase superfamily)